jgi:glutamate-ammonia-ligase adenylyltransferase
MSRGTTVAGQLAAMGFTDTARAQRLVTEDLGLDLAAADSAVLAALAAAADPDLALASLARLPYDTELRSALRSDPGFRGRLIAVLGASAALGGHLERHPGDWKVLQGPEALQHPAPGVLRHEMLTAVGARPGDHEPVAEPARPDGTHGAGSGLASTAPVLALRAAYRRRLLHLAARDLTGAEGLAEVTAELADLAAAALDAALAIARSGLPAGSAPCRLAVIAMGKCGGRELNYASDVDVIFVAEPAAVTGGGEAASLRTASRLATGMIRACSEGAAEEGLFPVDPNLRPEGRDGPLVRTLASHRAYYERWAKTWEFQALLKARPVAGDAELGEAYLATVRPMVWQSAQRENFVADVQAMRRRVIGSLPADQAGREIKLGPGGLRDIEFAVQLLQLVHGRTDETLRAAATLDALAALASGGYVGRDDAASLAAAYRFLRSVEHLLQLRRLRRTHMLPEDPAVLRQVGRGLSAMAGGGPPAADGQRRGDPADDLLTQWRRHAGQARQLHEKLFYRPLLEAVARLPGEAVRLTQEAARTRLEALGYADPAQALRHIEALTSGVSRRAAIQRTLLPVMLGWFADAAQPDAGLLAFRQVSEALGESSWYLRLLRDDTRVARRMARLLASSRYATGLLLRAPDAVAMLADDAQLAPRPVRALHLEALAAVRRHDTASEAVAAALALRRRELLRTAAADLLGVTGAEETGEALTTVAAVTIGAALDAATRKIENSAGPLPTRICVVAMGRLGGHEMGYASDADVMFVHEPCSGADEETATRAAHAVAEELRGLLARPGPDPVLPVDAGLRPEGRQGPLVRTLSSYRAYYQRWSAPWEAQALLRSEPVAGDAALGREFAAMADEFRYPGGGIGDTAVREIRRIKARIESERMPRGIDPVLHLKLGPGGLADVEWVAQLMQLRHGHAVPALRTTRTIAALQAARGEGLVDAADAAALTAAWLLATRIRNAVMLVRGRSGDTVPSSQPELGSVARLLGYAPEASQDLVQDYRRAARRARAVMERLFYG